MSRLITADGIYKLYQYDTESEFENRIVRQMDSILGGNCIYLDCKRKIGKRGGKRSIPDAFVLDFNSNVSPRLFVVETELASHDLFQHIGVQLLQFSYSYASSPRRVKQILFEEISKDGDIYGECEIKANQYGMRNTDNMLDVLVNKPFQALVIIDEAIPDLYKVVNNFKFPVEVIEVKTYKCEGNTIYKFTPLFEDITNAKESIERREQKTVDITEFDTIVVPAQEEGFKETFIGENRWYAIRMHATMLSQIKYIAAYRVSPVSAITHWAEVKDIIPWEDSGKYCVNFVDSAKEMEPIPLVSKSRVKAVQSPRYTSFDRLERAKTLNEVF